MKIKLNCDMGESFGIYNIGLDEEIMPHIDMANLACGFHASDSLTMQKSVHLATINAVEIGAHPSYQDLLGFGRRSIPSTQEEITALVLYQIGALDAFCKANNTKITYVKPHGALYNDMMKDQNIFKAILKAISSYSKDVKLFILSNEKNRLYKDIADIYKISLLYEVFADRNYNDDGTLVSRKYDNATINNENEILQRAQLLTNKNYIRSITGKKLFLDVDTICVHGDNQNALKFILALKNLISNI